MKKTRKLRLVKETIQLLSIRAGDASDPVHTTDKGGCTMVSIENYICIPQQDTGSFDNRV